MNRFPREPRDRSGLIQLRSILLMLGALALAGLTILLIVQAVQTPAPFFGFGK